MLRQPFAYATLLAVAGLIPFVALAAVVLLDPLDSPAAIQVLVCYGAVILAFLGGVQGGVSLVVLGARALGLCAVLTGRRMG